MALRWAEVGSRSGRRRCDSTRLLHHGAFEALKDQQEQIGALMARVRVRSRLDARVDHGQLGLLFAYLGQASHRK